MTNQTAAHTHMPGPNHVDPPWECSTQSGILDLMAGNKDAAAMLSIIAEWSHIYDDMIDKDKPVPEDLIHRVMQLLLIELPLNQFFRENDTLIRPLIVTGILNWRAANEMEKSGCLEQLHISHAIRYSICDVALLSMVICGGQEHANKNARRCRLMMQRDTWGNYLMEHHNEDN